MKIGLFAFALLLSFSAANAQTRVSNYVPGQNEEGVTYFLPQTTLHITVTAEKAVFTPGDFCRYAEKYLRLNSVSTESSEHWTIKDIKVTPIGEPDKDQAYTIELRDKTVAPLVELTDDGILKAINTHTQADNKVHEDAPEAAERPVNPRDYMTEEILMAGSRAKMAELTAKEIYNIRESKNSLTRGQADYMPTDGESLKIMLSNLNKQEEALMQLFEGTTVKETRKFTLTLNPTGDIDKDVLFRFSQKLGIVGANNLAGEPIYVSLKDMKTVSAPTPEEKAKKKLDGVVYNVPGKAHVTIFQGKEKFYEGEIPFAQFGNQEILSKKLFDKKTATQVIFDPTTGGVLKISAEE